MSLAEVGPHTCDRSVVIISFHAAKNQEAIEALVSTFKSQRFTLLLFRNLIGKLGFQKLSQADLQTFLYQTQVIQYIYVNFLNR